MISRWIFNVQLRQQFWILYFSSQVSVRFLLARLLFNSKIWIFESRWNVNFRFYGPWFSWTSLFGCSWYDDEDESWIGWDRIDEMVTEAEQRHSTRMTCPFLDWETEELKEKDDTRNDNSILCTIAKKRSKLVLYKDSSESDNGN